MNQLTGCQTKAISLNQILTSSSIHLPVYTRFRKTDLYLTVPVMSLQVVKDGIQIQTTQGESIWFGFDELQDIVVFQDASGKTIFLTDVGNGSNIAREIAEEFELWSERWNRKLRKEHDEYFKDSERCDYPPLHLLTSSKTEIKSPESNEFIEYPEAA